jgi:toxin-antitoxin system PIN domain toxin
MILTDVNILLYAHNRADPRYDAANVWLGELLSGGTPACFSWETINGFIRVSTNPRAMPTPISLKDSFAVVRDWMRTPNYLLLKPTDRHWRILTEVAAGANAQGSLFSDASLAALAIEHGATFATADRDFRRFDGLKIVNPLDK